MEVKLGEFSIIQSFYVTGGIGVIALNHTTCSDSLCVFSALVLCSATLKQYMWEKTVMHRNWTEVPWFCLST